MVAQTFGKAIAEEFLFQPSFRNLNHGSFGAIPKAIQRKQRGYQDSAEGRPDPFIRYEYDELLDESRAAMAQYLRVPTDTVVFVSNATLGINTVLRNLEWADDGKDEILYFDTIYAACGKSIDYIVETRRGQVSSRSIKLTYPLEDAEILSLFGAAVRASRAEGKRPRLCVYDVVSSLPGVRFPFETVTAACREEKVQSLIDGAQGVGMVDLDVGVLDPDFLVSNCHKWMHVPRGCAVFYVPFRNQGLIRSTLPTSHGYVSRGAGKRFNPLLSSGGRTDFVTNFGFVGTLDNSPYLCVKDAIRWRRTVLGGEERIREYTTTLAKDGGRRVAQILGTEVLDNSTRTLTNCAMVNVALPLWVGEGAEAERQAADTTFWMEQAVMKEYGTYIVIYTYKGRWWTRLSAQVYLDMNDFEFAGRVLKEICQRVDKKEHLKIVSKL